MEPKKLSSQELTNDIRTGMSDSDLKEKYHVSQNELETVFLKLVDYGAIDQSEMDLRRAKSAKKYTGNLLHAARVGKTVDAQEWIRYGANIEIRDKDGCTPLILASQNGHRDFVELLLNNGADITVKDKTSKTAASWAAIKGHTEIAGILWKHEVEQLPPAKSAQRSESDHNRKESQKYLYHNSPQPQFLDPHTPQTEINSERQKREPVKIEELRKEQRVFLCGLIGTLILAYVLVALLSFSTSHTVSEIVGAVTVMAKISWIYFVGRLSWILQQPVWLTILWCLLTPLSLFWVIPVIGLLIGLKQTKTKLMNAT